MIPSTESCKSPPPGAFILIGDLAKLMPFLDVLTRHELRALVITNPARTILEERANALWRSPHHPLGVITDLRWLAGDDSVGVVAQIRYWSAVYEVRGVLNISEQFVELAALATDLLGLDGVSLRAASVCRNKYLQRQYLRSFSPHSVLINPGDLVPDTRYPVVVKPLRLWSSMGVRRFESQLELKDHLSAAIEPVLVEERVEGREYNVDAVVVRHKPVTVMVTQKGTNESSTDFFAELVHTTPPDNATEAEVRQLAETHAALVRELEFGTGFAHAEYRITPDGRAVLMEVAARPPGDACLQLYQLSTGSPIEELLVRAALGEPLQPYPSPTRRARQVYLDLAPGKLIDVAVADDPDCVAWVTNSGVWPQFVPSIHDEHASDTLRAVLVLKPSGTMLEPIMESGDRAVSLIFDASLGRNIDAAEQRMRSRVTVEIEGEKERC